MRNYKFCFSGLTPNLATTALVSMYNVHTYGIYNNYFPAKTPKNEEMFCILITLKGNGEIHQKNGEIIHLPEKSAFFGRHNDISAIVSKCDHWHHTCGWFITQGISIPTNTVINIPDIDEEEESNATDYVIRLFQTQLENNVKYANSYFCCRLLQLLNKIHPNTISNNEFIEKALAYINRNIETPLTVKDLANHFHYSEKHIYHLFNVALNTTPKQFINNIKLSNVAHLLTTTTISLQELATQYNYASVSHLVNSFKKKYGITPSTYRKTRSQFF